MLRTSIDCFLNLKVAHVTTLHRKRMESLGCIDKVENSEVAFAAKKIIVEDQMIHPGDSHIILLIKG